MDTPKHTPGPWRIHRYAACVVEGEDGRTVATTGGYSDNTSDGAYVVENEANAHLIAAAPDLLATLKSTVIALEECADCLDSYRIGQLEAARSAIAKAEGRVE